MNDEQFQLLCRIDDELIQLCKWLNESRDIASASRLIPIMDEVTILVAEVGQSLQSQSHVTEI
jgi:hypothetical protein